MSLVCEVGLGGGLFNPNALGALSAPPGRGVVLLEGRSFPAAFAALTEARALRLGRVRGSTGFSLPEGAESPAPDDEPPLPPVFGIPIESESEPLLFESDDAVELLLPGAPSAAWKLCISWVGVLPSDDEGVALPLAALPPRSILRGRDAMVRCEAGVGAQKAAGPAGEAAGRCVSVRRTSASPSAGSCSPQIGRAHV